MREPSTSIPVVIIFCLFGMTILASLATLHRHRGPSPVITTKMHMLQVAEGTVAYHLQYGLWPTGYTQLYPQNNPNHIAFLYSDRWTTNDAWGHPLIYRVFDPVLGHGTVVSLARDGKHGGRGEDADIEQTFK